MKVCPKCKSEHNNSGLYCCRSCANSRTWSQEDKEKKSKAAKCSEKIKNRKKKLRYCKYCGALKGECERIDICKKYQVFPSLIKYFGFDEKVIGTIKLYEEFERIKNMLSEDYIINELSTIELSKKFNYPSFQNFNKTLKKLNIECRSHSKAISLAYTHNKLDKYRLVNSGKCTGKTIYKSGWHTTWNNQKVFLRSSYEFDYANLLDLHQVNYEVESLRMFYWDSQLLKQRMAIPDFYIPSTNTIVEIKGSYTFNKQNMEDRFEVFKKLGYNCKLVLNKKEIKLEDC